MTQRNWIGAGLALALCSTALASCSNKGNSPANENAAQSLDQHAWSDDAAKELQEIIVQAPANGLKPELFLKGDLPSDETQRATMLTDAALRYAGALARGYTDPAKISDIYTIPRPRVDVRQGLAEALQDGKLAEWYASLPPQTDEYKALSRAHLHFLKLANQPQPGPIVEGKPIKPGARDPRIPAVAGALKSIGYLEQPASTAAPSTRYSPDLVAAVKRVQTEFGLKADGIVGGDTLAALNLGPAGRARELAIAMERLRWLVRNPRPTRIDVNIASTMLDYWRDGQHVDRREVVAGEPDKPTPQIQAPMFQLVANPKWRVPDSIAQSELSKKSQSWLAANNFAMENGRYVQESGPKNSLGAVKFDMRDKQQIYLHDTPAKALFTLPDRHRSHGCVRVQGALAFAHALATENGVEDEFQKGLASGDETYVKLKTEIPVRLLYHTAFWDGQHIQFRPDVYGWDDNVAAALGLVRGVPRQPYQAQGEDIGP
ncbi:MAG TPA: L,D-transpeptidase family protein [Sphingomicrobium sp.]|nr:L,D-transpeptidase family protein [Sphingomicrobium sp.]